MKKNVKTITSAGEMAQRLRALAALPEGQGSIPSNPIVAHDCNPSFRGFNTSHRHTCMQNMNAHKIKMNKLFI